jgi:biopolymer transport protein ExbB
MITIRPLLAAGALILSATLAALAQETIPPVEPPAASAPVETAPATPPPPTAAAPAAAPDAASPPAAQAAPALSDAPAMPASGTDEQGNDATLEPILPHDLSPWGMFMAADIVVKAVMIGLAFASFVTWTVWLAKSLELLGARRRAQRACAVVVRVRSLNEAQAALAGRGGVVPLLVQAARQEAELSEAALGHAGGAGLKERVTSRLARIEALECVVLCM